MSKKSLREEFHPEGLQKRKFWGLPSSFLWCLLFLSAEPSCPECEIQNEKGCEQQRLVGQYYLDESALVPFFCSIFSPSSQYGVTGSSLLDWSGDSLRHFIPPSSTQQRASACFRAWRPLSFTGLMLRKNGFYYLFFPERWGGLGVLVECLPSTHRTLIPLNCK